MSEAFPSVKFDIVESDKKFDSKFNAEIVKQNLLDAWPVLDVKITGPDSGKFTAEILHLDAEVIPPTP